MTEQVSKQVRRSA